MVNVCTDDLRVLLILQEAEQGEEEDCSKDFYGNLPMNRSQEKRPVTHIPLEDIGRPLANQTVMVRSRLHTSRGKGAHACNISCLVLKI